MTRYGFPVYLPAGLRRSRFWCDKKLMRIAFVLGLGLTAACGGGGSAKGGGAGKNSDCVDAFLCAADCTSNTASSAAWTR
jgi:hypothetical protein